MTKRYRLLIALSLISLNIFAQENKKPFRIGVAGLTHGHVGWILTRDKDEDIEIVGIAEPDRELGERYLKQYNLPLTLLYSSLEEMLNKTKPEAVTGFSSTFD